MRLFIAIDFEIGVKEKMKSLQKEIREHSVKGRWKSIDNFHLTLKFLGEVSPNNIKEIDNCLNHVAKKGNPFVLNIDKLGMFNGKDSIRVLWLGINRQLKELNNLVLNIEEGLNTIGFSKEQRPYSPHITIAQDVLLKGSFDDIQRIREQYKFEQINVNRIALMNSEEIERKRVYTVIGEYELIDN